MSGQIPMEHIYDTLTMYVWDTTKGDWVSVGKLRDKSKKTAARIAHGEAVHHKSTEYMICREDTIKGKVIRKCLLIKKIGVENGTTK